MKKCKYCQSEIDAKAKVCPKCGKKQKHILRWVVLGIFAVIIIGAVAGGGEDIAEEGKVSKEETNQSSEKFTYEITNEYADEFGLSYYIEGSVKNNRDKEYSYVQIEFVCYDSDGNNLGTAIDNTNNLLGNETWKFKAMTMFSDSENVDHCNYKEITAY